MYYNSAMYIVHCAFLNNAIMLFFLHGRYFILSNAGLSYSKARGESIIHTIPISEMQAVERVDETAFNMKFVRFATHVLIL